MTPGLLSQFYPQALINQSPPGQHGLEMGRSRIVEESSPRPPPPPKLDWGPGGGGELLLRRAGLRCPPLPYSHAKSSLSQAAFLVGPLRQRSQSGEGWSEVVV